MNEGSAEALSVVVERTFPYPPEKIWRALTQQQLIGEWLMKSDFEPVVDRDFTFSADWGEVGGRVLTVQPHESLSYTWTAYGLESVVTWTLTPAGTGTVVRVEQSGFLPSQRQAYNGAKAGWPRFFAALEETLARID
jgi:uncharacterized protein YndB with AHSA1/START domain